LSWGAATPGSSLFLKGSRLTSQRGTTARLAWSLKGTTTRFTDDGESMTAEPRIEELRTGLDWAAFSARRFPNGRRHDLEAIAAYFAYKRVPREAAGKNGTAEEIEAWEDEGGSIR
jgi:hypothetical protein